ncbi:MAG: ATP-binding protein [Myxococcota bacterium]
MRRSSRGTEIARATDARLRDLAERAYDLALRLDLEGTIEHVTRGGCAWLRLAASRVEGRPLARLIHPDDLGSLWPVERHRRQSLVRVRCGDGEWRHLDASAIPHRTAEGERVVLLVGRDVTQHMNAWRSTRAQQGQFRLVADTVPVMLWATSADGGVTFLNRAGREFLGSHDEQRTETLRENYVHPDDIDELREAFLGAVVRRKSFSHQARSRHATLGWRWMLHTANPRHDDDGHFAGYVGASIDVTETLHAEVAERRAERLALFGKIATGIGRTLSDPLDSIASAARCARTAIARGADPSVAVAHLTRIEARASRAARLTRDLLHFPMGDSDEDRKPVDPNALIRQVVERERERQSAAHVKLECDLREGLPPVAMRRQEMAHALRSLIRNAIESSSRPVEVVVYSRMAGGPAADRIEIRIVDNGDGIPEHTLARIFDPFFTTRRDRGGAGLGLTLVQRIVWDHEGTIEVQSSTGGGSTFSVMLPVAS